MNNTTHSLAGKTVLISAGGTGGHVYPALSVAKALRERGATIHWLGTAKGIEARLVPEADIPLHTVTIEGVRGNGIKRLLKAPLVIARAIIDARAIIKKTTPDLYIGFGGFASGPGAVAAKTCSVPVVIHEQNAAMGLTNKIVSLWAQRTMLAFPIAKRSGTITGNPIRTEIAEIAHIREKRRPVAPYRLLVVGGSLGAKAINDVMPEALTILQNNDDNAAITVTHQTGATTFESTTSLYQQASVEQVSLTEYINDMASAYAEADIIIARAGALTTSEIASIGLPAVFIPLPYAVDNHQFLNAQFLVSNGAANIIEQQNLTAETLAATISRMLDARVLEDMTAKANALSHANALETITTIITEVLYANDTK